MEHLDLLVIGGGSGGLAAAQKAATFGVKVGLIESGRLGGTCVNVGCIPKKIMWYAAQFPELHHLSEAYGYTSNHFSFDFEKLVTHREQFIKTLNRTYEERLRKNNIHYIKGLASFIDPYTLSVGKTIYSAKQIILATGCHPTPSLIKGAEFGINSDGFFALKAQPKQVAIVGAGYVAIELACMLNQLGSQITLLIRHDKVLRQFDSMLSDSLMEMMLAQGIHILPFHNPKEIIREPHGQLSIHCQDNKLVSSIDTLIFAIGRTPQTQHLNLEAAQVKTDKHGFIPTDKWETTNIPHIFAVGDITGKKLLTPVAVAAGRQLARRLFGGQKDAYLDYENIPTVIFSHPPIATLGLSEEEADTQHGKEQLKIYQSHFNPLFYALSMQKIPTHMKLVTLKESEKIIGCHLIGLGADEILQGFAVAIKMGATKKDLDHTMAIHPTSAEELVLF